LAVWNLRCLSIRSLLCIRRRHGRGFSGAFLILVLPKKKENMERKIQSAKNLLSLVKNVDEKVIIIDGGCYVGNFSKIVTRIFNVPSILAFEPDPESFNIAKKNPIFHRGGSIVNAALGAKMGQAAFFRGPNPATNSLLQRPSIGLKPYFPEQAHLESGAFVEVVTLDHECHSRGIEFIDLLKLDLQGSELMALEGAQELLAGNAIKVILLEVVFIRKYKDQPLFWQIWQFLEKFGYTLYAIEEIKIGLYESTENNMRQGQWNQCDVIFISESLRVSLDALNT
jgi:FkbM family methyltransferase